MPVSTVDTNYTYPPPQPRTDSRADERAAPTDRVDQTGAPQANTEGRYRPQGEGVKIYFIDENLGQHVNVVV